MTGKTENVKMFDKVEHKNLLRKLVNIRIMLILITELKPSYNLENNL